MTTDFEEERKDLARAGLRTTLKLQSPMKKDVKERWLAALRSGEYKQGAGFLRQDIGERTTSPNLKDACHCCLGVLLEAEGERWTYRDDWSRVYVGCKTGKDSFLAQETLMEVGLGYESMVALSRANDWRRLSFKDIADAIEECL